MGEAELLRYAAKHQHSVFTTAQAQEFEVPARTIQARAARGRLVRMQRGVYLPSGVAAGWEQRLMGACLACGPGAAASHRSALLVWGLTDEEPVAPEVTVPGHRAVRHRGVETYRSFRMSGAEVVRHRGFRVTGPNRTYLDVAALLDEAYLERVLDAGHRRGLIRLEPLLGYLERSEHRRMPGVGRLRYLVSIRDPKRPIESELETDVFAALREAGLPLPVPQHWIQSPWGERRIDFAYPEPKVALEPEGFEWHDGRLRYDEDRAKRTELVRLGWRVVPCTSTMVADERVRFVCAVGEMLGLSPVRWRVA